jgi:hypothetical protein
MNQPPRRVPRGAYLVAIGFALAAAAALVFWSRADDQSGARSRGVDRLSRPQEPSVPAAPSTALEAELTRIAGEARRDEFEQRARSFREIAAKLGLSATRTNEIWAKLATAETEEEQRRRLAAELTREQLERYEQHRSALLERAAKPEQVQAEELASALDLDRAKKDAIARALAELDITEIERLDKWGDDYEGMLKEEVALSKELLRPILSPDELARYSAHLERQASEKLDKHRKEP